MITRKWYEKRTGIKVPGKRVKKPDKRSVLEARFESLWKLYGYDKYCPFDKQHRFHAERRYCFDFAWLTAKIALECDGGIWLKKGGHTTGTGKKRDAAKDWLAFQSGWRVIRWTPDMVTAENCKILCSIIYSLTKRNEPISLVTTAK